MHPVDSNNSPNIRMRQVDPNEMNQNAPAKNQTMTNLEGKTVYEAIHLTANQGDNLKITSLKGRFPRDTTNPEVIIADSYEVDGKKYFKFLVDWEAKIDGKTDSVKFSQAIFTNVEIPQSGTVEDLKYAERKAYQLAKSYELIQKNIVSQPPGIKTEDYKKQVDVLKKENQITFTKDESVKQRHQFSELKAQSKDVPLYLSREKVDKVSQKRFYRVDMFQTQLIILREAQGAPRAAEFQRKEASGVRAQPQEVDYQKHLKTQAEEHSERFNKLSTNLLGQMSKGEETRKTEQFKNAKADFLKAPSQNETERNREIASLHAKAGIPELEESLVQMKNAQKMYENATSLLDPLIVSTKPVAKVENDRSLAMKTHIQDVSKYIDDKKIDLLKPESTPVQAIPRVEVVFTEVSDEGSEESFEDLKQKSSEGSFKSPETPEESSKSSSSSEFKTLEGAESDSGYGYGSKYDTVQFDSQSEIAPQSRVLSEIENRLNEMKRHIILDTTGNKVPPESIAHDIYPVFFEAQSNLALMLERSDKDEILRDIESEVYIALETSVLWFDQVATLHIVKQDGENEQFFDLYEDMFKDLAEHYELAVPELSEKFKEVVELIKDKRIENEKREIAPEMVNKKGVSIEPRIESKNNAIPEKAPTADEIHASYTSAQYQLALRLKSHDTDEILREIKNDVETVIQASFMSFKQTPPKEIISYYRIMFVEILMKEKNPELKEAYKQVLKMIELKGVQAEKAQNAIIDQNLKSENIQKIYPNDVGVEKRVKSESDEMQSLSITEEQEVEGDDAASFEESDSDKQEPDGRVSSADSSDT